jgi:hypothetical protein
VKKHCFNDPLCMPGTGLGPEALYERALPLADAPGEAYVVRRGVAVTIADAAGVRFVDDLAGRPAVVVPLRDKDDRVTSLHGRYLHTVRGQNKMLTIGPGNGVVSAPGGWRAEPLILVEGLFDLLSLAVCGQRAIATIGRHTTWLAKAVEGRVVWLAFDTGKPGETEVERYREELCGAEFRRLPPPPRCKDWNTALMKRGPAVLKRWLREQLETEMR